MTGPYDDPDAPWREAERSWATWLVQQRYNVTDLGTATGNAPRTAAPMLTTPGSVLRAPDLQTVRAGVTEFWEVKLRSRADTDPATGIREHWMSRASFVDYVRAADATQAQVWIVLYEAPTALSPGRWLRASARRLRDLGHQGSRTGQNGDAVDAWIWPVTAMEVVAGPPVRLRAATPLLPNEGPQPPLDDSELDLAERTRRRRRDRPDPNESPAPAAARPALNAVEDSSALSLKIACRRLGLAAEPRYSLTRIGELGDQTDDVLELLHHGIRLFLVTGADLTTVMDPAQLAAFKAARLLEHAVVDGLPAGTRWIVDGSVPPDDADDILALLGRADAADGVNLGQWQVVHAAADANVVVSAGAGTGKTETMSERLIFLLSTVDETGRTDGEIRPRQFTADQVSLVTFTREAAQQMRTRLARSLMLRQRLCARCVSPVRAWMMQLSNAQISTLHGFAKQIVKDSGGAVGYGPGFRVAQKTLEFRAVLQRSFSAELAALAAGPDKKALPAAHAWEDHLEAVWEALDNNGTPAMSLAGPAAAAVDWGSPRGHGLAADVHRITVQSLARAADEFAGICRDDSAVPTSHLVPVAHAALRAAPRDPGGAATYLFVDEFQDTDALQIDLLLDFHELRGARMFVVGDIKQGIYRFRGAAGNAFTELGRRAQSRGLPPFIERTLTRNFRSGTALLESLDPHFARWGRAGLLDYKPKDRLQSHGAVPDRSAAVRLIPTRPYRELDAAARQIVDWRDASPDESLAVLCRQNYQAYEAKRLIQQLGGTCDLLVGGDFFRTPAAREMRVLLDALLAPDERAAVLELCQTRWAAGLLGAPPPPPLRDDDAERWTAASSVPRGWADRVAHAAADGDFLRDDLAGLHERVRLLRGLLQTGSALRLIVDAVSWFAPDGTAKPGDDAAERRRYQRCLDHLITLMDAAFAERPASVESILDWLRLQIATNHSVDEPVDLALMTGTGSTLALTVHKAKGLEFDRVIVPVTTTPFVGRRKAGRTSARVVASPGQPPRLLWEWNSTQRAADDGDLGVFSNYASDSPEAREDHDETIREETRLLYVAMTRARNEMVLLVPTTAGRRAGAAGAWADLLVSGGAS